MCNQSGIDFGRRNLTASDIEGKRVIEVGAMDVNGTFRQIVLPLKPLEYVGVDIEEGPGVDEICEASEVVRRFGENQFDVVISTEMLEHVRDWREIISNLKHVLRPGGIMLITTRSKGFPYHAYPNDFWRFEIEDMEKIFSDMGIEVLERDIPESPGVFIKLRKPAGFCENNLTNLSLFSMLTLRRKRRIGPLDVFWFEKKEVFGKFWTRARNSMRYRLGI